MRSWGFAATLRLQCAAAIQHHLKYHARTAVVPIAASSGKISSIHTISKPPTSADNALLLARASRVGASSGTFGLIIDGFFPPR
jgi:hypothetical protein